MSAAAVRVHIGSFSIPDRIAMSLAEASETRKARLIALRKRKEGEAVDNNG